MLTLAERVSLALTENTQTQLALAKAAGVKAPSVNDWLSGKTKSLKGKSLIGAAKFLRVNELWLSEGVGPMRPGQHRATVLHAQASAATYDIWPFKRVTRSRLADLSAEALADIDEHLELVVAKWEARAAASSRKPGRRRA